MGWRWSSTLLRLIVVGGYIAFFQIFHLQNNFIMTPPFYQNVKLGPIPKFFYHPAPLILGFLDFIADVSYFFITFFKVVMSCLIFLS